MIDAVIGGVMHGEAVRRTSANGNSYVTLKVRVPAGETSILANVICFNQTVCEGLLALTSGDSVVLAASLVPKLWQPADGQPKVTLDAQAHAMLTPYHVQRKKAVATPSKPQGRTGAQAFCDLVEDEV